MNDYVKVLESVPGVSAWLIRRSSSVQHQRYLLADRPESERTVERTSSVVTVFHDHDGKQGQSTVTLSGADAILTRSQVEDAVFRAGLQANRPYRLPRPRPLKAVSTFDPELAGGAGPALDRIQERAYAAMSGEAGVHLSSIEIFADRVETELRSSSGVVASKVDTGLLLDLVILARDGAEERESHGDYHVRRLADLDVEEIAGRHSRSARDLLHAELPATRTGPAVLTRGSFTPLFGPFRFITSGETLYRKMSPVAVGDAILGEREVRGDLLSIVSDPTLPFAGESTPFDEEGLALARLPVVENGVFRKVATSKRYADYLGIEPSGDWHNTVLAKGKTKLASLLEASDEPFVHIVEFSWLNPDQVRGNFSTEIRLAYEVSRSGTRVVKGGSVAGNVYDVLADVLLSEETENIGEYSGPSGIRLGKLTVTGA